MYVERNLNLCLSHREDVLNDAAGVLFRVPALLTVLRCRPTTTALRSPHILASTPLQALFQHLAPRRFQD